MAKYFGKVLIVVFVICTVSLGFAADHGDAPLVSGSTRNADIGDVHLFLDPNDNTRLVIAMTVQGFIVPSEAVNYSVFDPKLNYRFELETTGDARPDRSVQVSFSRKVTAGNNPQTATIRLPNGRKFTAPTTVSNLTSTSPTPVVTKDPKSGVELFAGEVDDPFPFDIVGFGRFVASVLAGGPDPTQLQRGRDSFAGYNTLAIALRLPLSMLGHCDGDVVGLLGATLADHGRDGHDEGRRDQLDRMGIPGVNVALMPFPRKDEYNHAGPQSDARGRFASSIVGTLTALGTNADNINLLAGLAVTNGDYLRVDLDTRTPVPAAATMRKRGSRTVAGWATT